MILPLLLFLSFCASKSAELKVIEVAEGSDVSLNCSSGTIKSQRINTRLRINTTEYLLLKNFQSPDVGYYECISGTHHQTFYLDLKPGSTNEHIIFFRASDEDSVFFFCKTLSSSSLNSGWFWTPRSSSSSSSSALRLELNDPHFNNRLWIRRKENDVSIKISPVRWRDSGKYSCYRNLASKDKVSVFQLVLVRVWSDWTTLGLLRCELSDQSPDLHVLWINRETGETFPAPLQVKDTALGQNWTCGVFLRSTLKAAFPLTLNITHTFSTTPPSPTLPQHNTHTEPDTTHTAAGNVTHNHDAGHGPSNTIIVVGLFITFIFILVAVVSAVCCTKTPEERTEDVTYADVKFIKKSDASTEPQLNCTHVPAEEENEVLYTTVKLS